MGFDVHGALAAGYTPDEVEAFLIQRSQPWAQPAPQPVAPSFGPPAAAPLRPAPAPAPTPMTDARAIVREQRDAAMGLPTQQTLNDAITGTPLYQPFVPRSLADLADPEMMPVAGSPVGGLSLSDIVPRSKWDVAIGLAGVLPGGKILRGIKGRIPDLHSLINERNTFYHATSPQNLEGIVNSGEIRPSARGGVSVSRVPQASKAEKGITLVIDANHPEMPQTRPFTEPTYRKTDAGMMRVSPTEWEEIPGGPMNPRFEFENRTLNQSLPFSTVKQVLIDRSALPEGYDVAGLVKTLADRGISAEIKEGGREMHSARVRK